MKKVLGRRPSGERLTKIKQSPNYIKGEFKNIVETSVNPNNVSIVKILKDFYKRPVTVVPDKELPGVKTDLSKLDSKNPSVVWFGHSSYMIKSGVLTILVDPVFSANASPVKFFGKAFPGSNIYTADDIPEVDLLLITHDHFDHLDYRTFLQLHRKVKKIIVPLGVGAHLEYWGADRSKITELDWWNGFHTESGIEITATPARHFSGRSIKRATSLWASYVLRHNGKKIFVGGDSGYDDQFKVIGNKFNGFDLAFLECGQYGADWPLIHMTPEQTVQAAKDLNVEVLFPVHWSKFVLSTHAWNEPIKRLSRCALVEKQKYVAPMIGEVYSLGMNYSQKNWWDFD